MKFKTILVIAGCGILLCFMGFYNYFPLTFFDTGTYIRSGFHNEVPIDRPVFYGLFLRHASLAESLWLVILCQGILLSVMTCYAFKYLSGTKNFLIPFVAYIFLITFFTGASVNVSELIPDIFTPVFLIGMGLLIFAENLSRRDLIIISILLLFSISVHNSHYLIAVVFMGIFTVAFLFKKGKKMLPFIMPQRIALIWGIILFTYLFSASVNYSLGAGFSGSKTSSIFLMGRLHETDILHEYLQSNCMNKSYRICQYKDSLPWDLLWDYNKSPLYKTGGWMANADEYSDIVRDILTTPKYLEKFLLRSGEASLKQFFLFDAGNTPKLAGSSSPYDAIAKFYPTAVKEYLSSKQNNEALSYTVINYFQKYVAAISIFLMLLALISGIPAKHKLFIFYIVLCLFINAAVCGSLSGVSDRYQSRVVWLLPLPIFILFSDHLSRRAGALFGRLNGGEPYRQRLS